MRILLAFDKFKGTLSSAEVATCVRDVLRAGSPEAEVRMVDLADGGDGTLGIVLSHGFAPMHVDSADAVGTPGSAVVGVTAGRAFLEMASICGIAALDGRLDGLRATSYGLGLAARGVLDAGVEHVTISLGGSASTDGGLGFLMGLGAGALDLAGDPCSPDLLGLARVARLELTTLHPRAASVAWDFLTDVDSPLTGPTGAARLFGPQKGLDADGVLLAERALTRWADFVKRTGGRDLSTVPGAGAAGGVVVGASAALDLTITSGAAFVADLVGLDDLLDWADLVITGEGSLDAQSLQGKGPGLVLSRARARGTSVAVIAGRAELQPGPLGLVALATLEDQAGGAAAALAEPRRWLRAATSDLIRQLRRTTTYRTRIPVTSEPDSRATGREDDSDSPREAPA